VLFLAPPSVIFKPPGVISISTQCYFKNPAFSKILPGVISKYGVFSGFFPVLFSDHPVLFPNAPNYKGFTRCYFWPHPVLFPYRPSVISKTRLFQRFYPVLFFGGMTGFPGVIF
jgi:hypothetical protein